MADREELPARPERSGSLIVHLVTFRWKNDVTQADVDSLCDQLRKLAPQIPGLLAFQFGINAGLRTGTGDFGIVAVMETAEALHAYMEHPEHKKVVQEWTNRMSAARIPVQFELPLAASMGPLLQADTSAYPAEGTKG
jgi:hypothetical protein